MKKLENLRLKGGVKVLTTSDMKMLKGGSFPCYCDTYYAGMAENVDQCLRWCRVN